MRCSAATSPGSHRVAWYFLPPPPTSNLQGDRALYCKGAMHVGEKDSSTIKIRATSGAPAAPPQQQYMSLGLCGKDHVAKQLVRLQAALHQIYNNASGERQQPPGVTLLGGFTETCNEGREAGPGVVADNSTPPAHTTRQRKPSKACHAPRQHARNMSWHTTHTHTLVGTQHAHKRPRN